MNIPPIAVLGLLLAGPLAAACHENGCSQPPFYECGTYDREERIFCYYLIQGQYVHALEEDVLNITVKPLPSPLAAPGDLPQRYVAYVWLKPLREFAEEPLDAPLPWTVWLESNDVAGLQARPFQCGTFVWYAFYPGCWLGPFNVIWKPADTRVG